MSGAERIRAFIAQAKRWSSLGIVAANAVPIVCVILFGWPAGVLLILYWCENVIIGGFNGLKMAVSGAALGPPGWIASGFMLPFYVVHYGLFCFVHGVFVMVLSSFSLKGLANFDPSLTGLFRTVEGLARHEQGFVWSLAAIVGWQALSFVTDFLAKGKFRQTNPMTQMFEPYGRIVVLHLAIMIGAIPVIFLGGPVWALVGLAVMKTLMELGRLGQFKPSEESLAQSQEAFEDLRQKLQGRR
jgi:hypothetical protein